MSDKHFVGLKLTGFEDNGKQRPISRVTLKRDDENAVTAGDDTGAELIADCPHATQAMCDAILRKVKGYAYQAYRADDANLDPAAELGDGITASGVYSVISRIDDDGSGYAGAAAPGDPEMEDEFPIDGPLTQEFNRRFGGLRSYINKTASEIRMGVADDLNDLEASFTISLNGITAQINDLDGNISRVEQKADSYNLNIRNDMKKLETSINISLEGIQTSIQDDINGLETSFNLSLSEIRTSIQDDINGLETSFNLSLSEIRTSIRDAEGNISTLQQTATSLSSRINGVDSRVTEISQSLDSITLSVSNGETSSKISIVKDGVSVSSKTIRFTGQIIFEDDLSDGQTVISGDNIQTGEISSDYLKLYGPMEVYEDDRARYLAGYIGFVEGEAYNDNGSIRATEGIGVKAPSPSRNYDGGMVICTDSGARLTYGPDEFGSTTTIACVSDHCFSSEPMETFSDARLKCDIAYDLEDRFVNLYRSLKPCRFRMKDKPEGAEHLGFIAQDVWSALQKDGKTMSDFAALTQMRGTDDEEGIYTIRYGELTALNTAFIQKLMSQIEELKQEINQLRS